jgi:hypothetical protein
MINSLTIVEKNEFNIDIIDVLIDRIELNGYWNSIIYEDISINENTEQDSNLVKDKVSSYSFISLDSYENNSNHSINISNSSYQSPNASISSSVGLQLSPNYQQNSVNSIQIQSKQHSIVLNSPDSTIVSNSKSNHTNSSQTNINIYQDQQNRLETRSYSSSISSVASSSGYPIKSLLGSPISSTGGNGVKGINISKSISIFFMSLSLSLYIFYILY